MKALVVYESMFGNTERVARAVAAGLGEVVETRLAEVLSAGSALDDDVALVVVGGPTHAFSMSRPTTRADAITRGATEGEQAMGIREWLEGLRSGGAATRIATFDTRVSSVRHLPGSAAKAAAKLAHRHGFDRLAPAESFYVEDTEGPLVPGELERATAWGRQLGAMVNEVRTAGGR
jgi:hypothetical protein